MTLVIVFISTNIVYAKYVTTERISARIGIAKPIFIVEGNETIKINEINNIGYYEFVIKNFNETKISEIGFLYTIEVITNINEAIQFELYNGDIEIPLENLKTKTILIKSNEKIEQKYKLKITYDNKIKTVENGILGEVQIKVDSEQI